MILRLLDAGHIEISLREHYRSFSLLLLVGFASLLLAAGTLFVETTLSFRAPSVGWWILTVDPGNPRVEHRLGRLYSDTDPAEGVKHLRRAAKLSPNVQRYWARLASACESIDDTSCADGAWEHLANLCPMVPLYHWQAGRSYLHTNQVDEASAQFRRLLNLDSNYGPQAWFALRSVLDPDVIFQRTVADLGDSKTKVEYVDFLSGQGDYDAAYRIWKLVALKPFSFPFSAAKPYLERLIADERIQEARSVWSDLQRLEIVKEPEGDQTNLIFNGDFEQAPVDAGFDWRRSDRLTYLSVNFSAAGTYHGARCLRVDFTVNRNEEYEPVYQIVPVLPNRRYKLEAYVRSEDITSDTGPSLRVSDPQRLSFENVLSDTTVGTTPWHPVQLYFSTGGETQTVRLSVWRPRGRTFPTEISGSFWLDSVSLYEMGRAVEQGADPQR